MRLRFRVRPPRFAWAALAGRCRRRLAAGLVLLALSGVVALFAGRQFAHRGADLRAPDQPLVRLAADLARAPDAVSALTPRDDRELYLLAVISDQRDMLFGLTVLLLRAIVALTLGGLGIVLLTAGSTEWQIRTEQAAAGGAASE
jgi:hypothetical protein